MILYRYNLALILDFKLIYNVHYLNFDILPLYTLLI